MGIDEKASLLGSSGSSTAFYTPSLADRLNRKKSIERSLAERDGELGGQKPKKTLKFLDLIAYGISGTLGSGIFSLSGIVAYKTAGPSTVLSFIFAGLACVFSALSYSEFAARLPMAGSAFSYAYASMGEFIAFIIGWSLTLEYGISAAVIGRSWSSYVQHLLSVIGIPLPDWLFGYQVGPFSTSIAAVIVIVLLSIVVAVGVKESATFNNFLTLLNLVIIGFTIGYGSTFIETKNWDNFFPYGIKGTLSGAGVVFFSYIGFDCVSSLAEETINPQRDLPRGIYGSLFSCMALYVSVVLVMTGMLNWSELSSSYPLSQAFDAHGAAWASQLVAVGAVISLSGSTLCTLLGFPRILYRMSQDGLLPSIFGKLHPKYGTAVWSIAVNALVSGGIAWVFDLDQIVNMCSIGTLLAFSIVCASVVILRYKPESEGKTKNFTTSYLGGFAVFATALAVAINYHAPYWVWGVLATGMLSFVYLLSCLPVVSIPTTFQCPLVPIVPCTGIFLNLVMMFSLDYESWIRLAIWFVIGLAIYFGYSFSHSKLGRESMLAGSKNSKYTAINSSKDAEHVM